MNATKCEIAGPLGMDTPGRDLMRYGMFLFLLGLLTGIFEQRFTNVRMGLSAHLEGVMNGTFLIALGAIWTQVRLPRLARHVAFATALYGTYSNWGTTTVAAMFGTAANNPIAAAGQNGLPWQENLIAAAFLSVALSMLVSTAVILWGLLAPPAQTSTVE